MGSRRRRSGRRAGRRNRRVPLRPGRPRRLIFVDSSFWIATRFPRDAHHNPAQALLARFATTALVTTSHVRAETWTFLRRRVGHGSAMHFLDRLADTRRVQVVFVDEDLERDAHEWLRRHDERPCSVVDATSFALMRRLGIRDAFAFDGDFAAAGFVELRPLHLPGASLEG